MSVNADLRDAALRHRLGLHRLSNATLRKVLALLDGAERDVLDRIHKRLLKIADRGFDTGAVTTRMLKELAAEIRVANREALTALGRTIARDLEKLAEYELDFQRQTFASVPPVPVRLQMIAPEKVVAIATRRPFQGRLLTEWAKSIEADRVTKMQQAIRLGLLEGEGIQAIVRRISGTRATGYSDGIMAISRRNAETIVRTATAHISASVQEDLWQANADILRGVTWVSTLDGRTTPGCAVRDGKLYSAKSHAPIGHSIPWEGGPGRRHMACRSVGAPALKSYRELGVDLDDAPTGSRAAWGGQVSAETTALQWLQSPQNEAFARQVFGDTRVRLLRQGRLTTRDLFSSRGEYWTLDELRAREAVAFVLAGFRVAA